MRGSTRRKPGYSWIAIEYIGGWCCGSTVCNLVDGWSSTHWDQQDSAVALSHWEAAPVLLAEEEKTQHLLST